MNKSIHGHAVMRLIAAADPPLTRDALDAEVARRFGAGVCFHACAGDNMTLGQLLEFLTARGKLAEHNGRLRTDLEQICAHDE